MKAVEITTPGAPEVLRLGDRPVPAAGPGEVLVRVTASGVNRPDVLQRTGNYPVPPGASDIPGLEVAGVILSGDAQAMQAAGLAVVVWSYPRGPMLDKNGETAFDICAYAAHMAALSRLRKPVGDSLR